MQYLGLFVVIAVTLYVVLFVVISILDPLE